MKMVSRVFCLFAVLCSGRGVTYALEPDAYVVKIDSDTVYFDTAVSSGLVTGKLFSIFEEGEELINPATGAKLGKIITTIAAGTITDIQPKYAAGRIDRRISEIKPGQKAHWADAGDVLKPAPQENSSPANLQRLLEIPERIISVSLGDIDGDGSNELIAASDKKVLCYAYEEGGVKPCGRWQTGTARKILSAAAADLKKSGKAQIYVSELNEFSNRIETSVLEQQDKQLKKTGAVKWLVRDIPDESGTARLYCQELFDNQFLDRSGIRRLPASPAIRA